MFKANYMLVGLCITIKGALVQQKKIQNRIILEIKVFEVTSFKTYSSYQLYALPFSEDLHTQLFPVEIFRKHL